MEMLDGIATVSIYCITGSLGSFRAMKLWVEQHVPSPLVAAFVSFSLILLCSTLLAVASYRWLEQPFLRLKQRFGS